MPRRRGQRAEASVLRRVERGATQRRDLRQRLAAARLRQRVITAAEEAAADSPARRQARRLQRFREYRSRVAAEAAEVFRSSLAEQAAAAGGSAPSAPAAVSPAPRRRVTWSDVGDGGVSHTHRRVAKSRDSTAVRDSVHERTTRRSPRESSLPAARHPVGTAPGVRRGRERIRQLDVQAEGLHREPVERDPRPHAKRRDVAGPVGQHPVRRRHGSIGHESVLQVGDADRPSSSSHRAPGDDERRIRSVPKAGGQVQSAHDGPRTVSSSPSPELRVRRRRVSAVGQDPAVGETDRRVREGRNRQGERQRALRGDAVSSASSRPNPLVAQRADDSRLARHEEDDTELRHRQQRDGGPHGDRGDREVRRQGQRQGEVQGLRQVGQRQVLRLQERRRKRSREGSSTSEGQEPQPERRGRWQ